MNGSHRIHVENSDIVQGLTIYHSTQTGSPNISRSRSVSCRIEKWANYGRRKDQKRRISYRLRPYDGRSYRPS